MSDTPPNAEDSVVIERVVDAPIDLVWQLWTRAEHFQAWYGPTGATIPVATMDVRVGGTRHIGMAMETPNGAMQMWFVGEYREIDEPNRLVYTESMADEQGNVKSAAEMGMPADHPTVTEILVELEDLGGRTKMVVTHVGIPEGSPGAMGWNMALDKLDALASGLSGR